MIETTFHRDETSQLIRWGHWFSLFNIIISIAIGSRYFFISDWPVTFLGRFYAIVSCIGQFSFLTFLTYLVLLFPLTFIVRSYYRLRWFATIIAAVGYTLLLCDLILYSYFKLHLNLTVFDLLFTDTISIVNGWSLLIILFVGIFCLEFLLATLIWKKLRILHKRKRLVAKPALIFFISAFLFSHLVHLWADANFYRPITMQRTILPLSYPLTARHLLGKYGIIDEASYELHIEEEGNPFSNSIEYPLQKISYGQQENAYNLLFITLDDINSVIIEKDMPDLNQFAQKNIIFNKHYSSSTISDISFFSFFYGLNPNYYDAIMNGRENSLLINALNYRKYRFGLFYGNEMNTPFFRQTLLADFSIPSVTHSENKQILSEWQKWLDDQDNEQLWYSHLHFNTAAYLQDNKTVYKEINEYIRSIIEQLEQHQFIDNTIIIVTANHNITTDKIAQTNNLFPIEAINVPLIIHWPGKSANTIDYKTAHVDIMQTLMKDLLAVKTSTRYYAQGTNLFTENGRRSWIIAGDNNQLLFYFNDNKVIMLDQKGRYHVYDAQGNQQKKEKIDVSLFLQVLTENQRFIAR